MKISELFISFGQEVPESINIQRAEYNLDTVVKKIGESFGNLDDFRIKRNTNAKVLLYNFVKYEIEIFIALNSRNSHMFEKFNELRDDMENLVIVEKYLKEHHEQYTKELKNIFKNTIYKDELMQLANKMQGEVFREYNLDGDILNFFNEIKVFSEMEHILKNYI